MRHLKISAGTFPRQAQQGVALAEQIEVIRHPIVVLHGRHHLMDDGPLRQERNPAEIPQRLKDLRRLCHAPKRVPADRTCNVDERLQRRTKAFNTSTALAST